MRTQLWVPVPCPAARTCDLCFGLPICKVGSPGKGASARAIVGTSWTPVGTAPTSVQRSPPCMCSLLPSRAQGLGILSWDCVTLAQGTLRDPVAPPHPSQMLLQDELSLDESRARFLNLCTLALRAGPSVF